MIPSWAIGTAFVICVVACAQVVVRRLIGSTDRSAGQNPTEPDVARLTQALDEVQRRLGELEERMDFDERHAADVVIVDIFMPGQGGLQTIGRLRREWPAVKIVAMSGVKSAGAIDVGGHAVALGADRFVTKPFEADTLVALVDTLLRQKEGGSP